MKTQTIIIPVHPDELDVLRSVVHIPLSPGRYVTLEGPLAPKTGRALIATLEACKDCLVQPQSPDAIFTI